MAGKRTWQRVALFSAVILGLLAAGKIVAVLVLTTTSPTWRLMRSALWATYVSPASYTQVVERQFGSGRREEFRVWQAGPRRKVVQVSPSTLGGATVFRDHLSETAFVPGFRYSLENRFAPGMPGEGPPRLRGFGLRPLNVTVSAETLAGHGQLRVLTLRAGGAVKLRFWVNPRTNFIVRQERYTPNGRLLDLTENRDLVVSPAGLSEALKVTPPQGTVKLTDARRWRSELVAFTLAKEAPFAFLWPRRLSGNFGLVDGEVLQTSGTQVIALTFARHRAGFTLFEYPAGATGVDLPGDGLPLPPPEFRGRRVGFFRTVKSGLALVAVGRLTEAEFREVTTSLQEISPRTVQDKPNASRTLVK